jgi:hypothetical protein
MKMPADKNLSDLQLNIDLPLTGYSLGIKPLPGVAEFLFPSLAFPTQKASIRKWGYDAFIIQDDEIGARGIPKKVEVSEDKVEFTIGTRARMADWSPEEQASASRSVFPWDLAQRKQYVLNEVMDLRGEYLAAVLAQNASLYGSNTSDLTSDSLKVDDPTKNPLAYIKHRIDLEIADGCGFPPNRMVIASDVWVAISTNPLVIAEIRGVNSSQSFITEQDLAKHLGLAEVRVARSVGRDAAGAVSSRLWTKTMVLAYVNDQPSEESLSYGRTAYWDVLGPDFVQGAGGSGTAGGRTVAKWWDPMPGGSGVWQIKQARRESPVLLAATAGWLFTRCIS